MADVSTDWMIRKTATNKQCFAITKNHETHLTKITFKNRILVIRFAAGRCKLAFLSVVDRRIVGRILLGKSLTDNS